MEQTTLNKPQNLMEGLLAEMNRAREILMHYEGIPQGVFGATMIIHTIQKAELAISTGDTVAMIVSLKELREVK